EGRNRLRIGCSGPGARDARPRPLSPTVRPTSMGPDWKSWDHETVRREVASLAMGDLVGVPEVEVRARFGEPDDVVRPGGETSDLAGNVLFRADADLRY